MALLGACGGGTTPSAPQPAPSASAVTTATPAPSSTATLALIGSTPAAGSTIQAVECSAGFCADFDMSFEVTSRESLSSTIVVVELLDAAGHVCADSGTRVADVAPGTTTRFTARHFDLSSSVGCRLFSSASSFATERVHATLRSPTGDAAQVSADAAYTFVGPPLSSAATTPEITELCWHTLGHPSGGWCGDGPLPGERADYRCVVQDRDGDALHLTLSYEKEGGCPTADHCWRISDDFAPRFVPATVEVTARGVNPGAGRSTLTCRATDARGRETVQSVCIQCR